MKQRPVTTALAYALLCLMAGCFSVRPPDDISRSTMAKKIVIIFVPGYYGTALADKKTGERLHLSFGNAVFGGPPLAINPDKLDIPDGREIRPDGVLESATILPWLYSIDIHAFMMRTLSEDFPSARIVAFPYDWRDSNVKAARQLDALVDRIRDAGASKIGIVGFSNGGVVTSYFLRYGGQQLHTAKENWAGAKKIDCVVLAGTPFRGSMRAFYNAQYGVKLGLAEHPLNPVAMASFPSLYELLPAEGADLFLNPQALSLQSEVYDSKSWVKNNWGLFKVKESLSEEATMKRERYLDEELDAGAVFSNKIIAEPSVNLNAKLPALVIKGRGHPTLKKAIWSGKTLMQSGKWDFSSKAVFAEGDGTVTLDSGTLPAGYQTSLQAEVFELETEHAKMVSAPQTLTRIRKFLASQGF